MASRERHWVEDLFPPVYQLSIDDLLEEDEPKPASVYELAAKRISKFDPETIKNVFERVWLMKTVEEQQRQAQEEAGTADTTLQHQGSTTLLSVQGTGHASTTMGVTLNPLEQVILEALREGQEKTVPRAEGDIQDSPLWNSNEISEIRKVYNAARKENIKLRAALEETESRIVKIEKKNHEQFAQFSGKEGILMETQKANKRLQIMCETLKSSLEELERENEEIQDEMNEWKTRHLELAKEKSDMKKAYDVERIRSQKAVREVEEIRKEVQRDAELHMERLELKYERQIEKLYQELEKTTSDLDKEKLDHIRSKKGLEHLQKHFSALPYKESERKNMVTSDQLTKWTL